jgi:hypothetical protein
MKSRVQSGVRWVGAGIALGAAAYASYVGVTWCRYGHAKGPADGKDKDTQLDQFIPIYEVVERHSISVAAPAETTFSVACEMNLEQSAIIRAIFKGRELIFGSEPSPPARPLGIVVQAKEWGWGMLAESPGHEIIFGGVTQPWLANPVFRALPPGEFEAFREPGFVKIAWTLRADPVDEAQSVFLTETRATTTDPVSRAKFRRYWAFLSPGIILIRRMSLRLAKREAERRTREATSTREEDLWQET